MINLGIVGLGLIGASIAKALCNKESYTLYGADSNGYIVEQAVNEGAIANPITDMAELDAVIFATPPKVTKELINGGKYKKDAVVMDVCGVKGYINEIRQDIDFVGMHPMAGKELSGYDNGDGAMFKGKNLLLIKREGTSERACSLAEQIGKDLGFGVLQWTDVETHDSLIAFTSQMPHMLSAIMVQSEMYDNCHSFEGGSLNDFTRIARLDAPMWAELFYQNRDNLREQCNYYIEELTRFLNMLEDTQAMESYMRAARNRRIAHEEQE